MEKIKSLVGNIKKEQMHHIDSYVGGNIGVFLPVTGYCGYAVTKNHTHPSYSFIITPTGISISGNYIKKDCDSNIIIAMSPDFPHHEDVSEGFNRYFAIFINKVFFESIYKSYDPKIPYFENSVYCENVDVLPTIKQYMSELRDELPGYKRQVELLEERITHLIVRNCLNLHSTVKEVDHRMEVDKVVEYIHNNYMNKLNTVELASMVNSSASNFSRMFKNSMGSTLSSYIIKIRLERGKKMIESGNHTMTDIAYSCGFSSPGHFSTLCKKEFGYTPIEYKNYLIGKII